MNNENLKMIKTHKEAVRKGRNGGLASVKAKKDRKNMREMLNMLLDMPNNDEDIAELDINKADKNNRMKVVVSLMNQAINGDTRATKLLCELSGDLEEKNEEQEINLEDRIKDFKIEIVDASSKKEK